MKFEKRLNSLECEKDNYKVIIYPKKHKFGFDIRVNLDANGLNYYHNKTSTKNIEEAKEIAKKMLVDLSLTAINDAKKNIKKLEQIVAI